MGSTKMSLLLASVSCAFLLSVSGASAQYAANVASYAAGTTPSPGGYTSPAAALGSPERLTGEGVFPGVVSPFSPPFLNSEIVSIGEGGQLTLRLANYAVPQAAAPEIGVFSNFGLVDVDFPNGRAGNPAGGFAPPDSALVEVSANGTNWISLGNSAFDIPTNGYADVTDPFAGAAGSVPSDFQQPFTGGLGSFNGLAHFDAGGPDILEVLAGSGGGKWLDISGTGLAQVGFIRFSIADDGNVSTSLNFEIDGVSVSHAALGGVVVPEPAAMLLSLVAISAIAISSQRKFRARAAGSVRGRTKPTARSPESRSGH